MYCRSLSHVPAVRFGIDNGENAIKQLELQENITIKNCDFVRWLFVDQEYEFLGTKPDGKYADGIVEIKCLKSVHEFPLEDAMKKHDLWKSDSSSNSYIINRNHHWYYQIQELVDPRDPRRIPIRNPPFVLKAMDELKVRKERKEELKRKRQEKLEKKENIDERKVTEKRKRK